MYMTFFMIVVSFILSHFVEVISVPILIEVPTHECSYAIDRISYWQAAVYTYHL